MDTAMNETTTLSCFACDKRIVTKKTVPVGELYWCGSGWCQPELLPDAGEKNTWKEVGQFGGFHVFCRVPIPASGSNDLAVVTGWDARFHSSGQCGEGCQICAARRAEEIRRAEALAREAEERAKEAQEEAKRESAREKEAEELEGMVKRGLLVNRKALTTRGWTETGIKKFLGEPHRIELRHRDGVGDYVLHWYLETSVVAAEASPAFLAFQAGKAARSATARKGVETKHDKTMEFVRELDIEVPILGREKLVHLACESYNELAGQRSTERRDDGYLSASSGSDPAFLARITVNYIRHQLTIYESALYAQFGKVGVEDAVDAIRSKVYAAIAEAYPDLAEECERQEDRRQAARGDGE
jgi:hypothetical protein